MITTPVPVGVDDGHAVIKVVADGIRISIPARGRAGHHTIGRLDGAPQIHGGLYECDGEAWQIDPDLVDEESTRFPHYPVSGLNAALVLHALHVAGLDSREARERGLVITTGLPIKDFFVAGGARNEKLIGEKQRQFNRALRPVGGGQMARIVSHQVAPEGVAAWVSYACARGINPDSAPRWIAMVDIGGHTTDVPVIQPRRNLVDHAHSSSIAHGVLDVVQQVQTAMAQCGKPVSAVAIDEALRAYSRYGVASVVTQRRREEVTGLIEKAVRAVGGMIGRQVDRAISDISADVGLIVLVGGGARLLGRHLGIEGVVVADDPEFANALGFLVRARAAGE